MAFRTNLYEQENEKDSSRQHRHSFVNRLRTHTDGELSMNSTSFSHFNMLPNMDDSGRSSRRNNHRFGINQHHIAGEVMAGYTQPSNALPIPSMYSSDRNTSPLARSFRKLRSSTWDAGHGNLKLSPKMFGSSIAGNGLDRSNNLDQGKGRPAIDEDDSLDDEVVSFSSSSEESLEDAAAAATTIHIPMLDEEDELKEGLQSSLYQDEQDTTPLRSNTQLLIEANKNSTSHSNAENADHKRNNIPQRPSLRRDKSSSSADGVRRSVTFSTMVGLEQYADSEKLEDGNEMNTETTPDQVEQSPNSIDSAMYYHPETTHYEEQHRHQQRASNATKNDQFFDHFNPFSDLSWSLVGSYIVRYAPCFICMKKLGVSATDRNVLLRLNLLCAFHSVVQIALGIFLFVVTVLGVKQTNEYYANEANTQSLTTTGISKTVTLKKSDDSLTDVASADLWNLMLFVWILSVVSLVLLLASYFAQKAIRNVNLVRSVRFMWTLFWLLPIQIFLMIGLFDYYGVMDVYTKHWWDEPSMAWFRENLCKKDTSFTKCTVPIDGGEDYDSEEQWCEAYYDSLDCREIRDSAQTLFESFSYVFFTANGVWALLLVALMYVTLCVLQGIISLPIVQRSKESNIPLWLTFPIAGCFLIGSILLYGPSTVTDSFQDLYMIGIAYLVTGGAFALAAIMGISLKCYTVLNKRQKKCKQGLVVVFIVTIVVTIFSVTTIFATSIIYSLNIIKIPTNAYHEIACMLDTGGSCTGCDSMYPDEICPEWSEGDVARVLKTIMKQSATVAAIFFVYALTTLRYGFLLLKHVSSYQIDYV